MLLCWLMVIMLSDEGGDGKHEFAFWLAPNVLGGDRSRRVGRFYVGFILPLL